MHRETLEELLEEVDCTVDDSGYGEGNVEELLEIVIRECASMTKNLSPHGEYAEKAILEHYGLH